MTREVMQQALEALDELTDKINDDSQLDQYLDVMDALREALAPPWTPEDMAYRPGGLAQPEHPKQMARLGWQYVECPACGSEGARAFPKPAQEPVAVVTGQYDFPMMQWRSVKHQMSTAIGSLLFTSPPQRQPMKHEQRLDLLTAFEKHKHEWNAESILIDMVEAAHDIGNKT